MSEELIEKYNECIELINTISEDKLVLLKDEAVIIEFLNKYFNNIKENPKFKKYLLIRKIKLFYSDNLKLFDNFNIRKVFDKANNKQINELWNYLQLFYILQDKENSNYSLKLINNIENTINNKSPENNQLVVKENNAEGLIQDIIFSVKDILKDLSSNNTENPLENLIKISKTISEKYSEEIKEGKITIEDIMTSVQKVLADGNLINEDMFSDINISEEKISGLFKNILNEEQLKNIGNLGNIGNFNNLFKNILKSDIEKQSVDDKPLEDKKLDKMEEYFKNISTDNPDGGKITLDEEDLKEEEMEGIDLGGLSNMLMSQMGNLNKTVEESGIDLGGLSNMLMSQVKDMDIKNPEDVNFNKLNDIRDNLLNNLSDKQKDDINNLTNTLLKGFNN